MAVTFRIVGIYCKLTLTDEQYNSLIARVPEPKVRDVMDELSTLNPEFQFKGDDQINPVFTRDNSTLYSAKFTVLTPGVVSGSGRPIPVDTYKLVDSFDNTNTDVYHEFQYYIQRPLEAGGLQSVSGGGAFIPFGSAASETIQNGDQITWRMVSIVLPDTDSHPLRMRMRMRMAGLRSRES